MLISLMTTIVDSVLVTVFNGNLNNILEFGFAIENNPFLPYDITGNILQDSVLLFLPEGVPPMNLVSSFSLSNCAKDFRKWRKSNLAEFRFRILPIRLFMR